MTTSGPEPHWLGRVDRWIRSHGWAGDVLTALAVLAVLGALSVSGAQGIHWSADWVAVLIVCFALLHLTVAVRSRAPEVAYAVAAAALLVIVLAPDGRVTDHVPGGPTHVPALFLPSSLVFLFALYSAASCLDAVRSRVALAIALVGVAIATASVTGALRQLTADGWLVSFYTGLGLGTAVLVTWNLGRLAQVRRRRALTERAETARLAVLEERARIAREMHDIVAHSLAVIVRQAEGGAFVADRDPARAGQSLRTIAATGRGALADMRGLLGVLRDPDGDERSGAPQPTLADLPRLVASVRDAGLDAELIQSGKAFPLTAATELAIYRLAQEGLTNAVKHAGPRARVAVDLRWEPAELTVQVIDDGRGAAQAVPGAGVGLQGLRDRIGAVGGTFTTDQLEPGFRVRARFTRPAAEVRR
ncbi:MAG TPA: sensor histidine kinase [Streptosporangiaceae bacterium]|nr:sensor histidine kinase [Streptosporangiaceae bacterium]